MREHVFEKHADCRRAHCMICDGGLQSCTVCGEGEGTLAAECPGPPSQLCSLGVGCEQASMCYAAAMGEPERCGR